MNNKELALVSPVPPWLGWSKPPGWKWLWSSVLVAAITTLENVTFSVAFAGLIFSSNLKDHVPEGIQLGLWGAAVNGLGFSLWSSLLGMVATLQEAPIPFLKYMVGSILAETADYPAAALPTVLAALALTTMLTGLMTFLLGALKLGNLIRYIPYPVIGGFLAGTGWLLITGAMTFMLKSYTLGDLARPDVLLKWMPGAIFALIYLAGMIRFHHQVWVTPAMVAGSIALFYLFLAVTGTTLTEVKEAGLLLGPFAAPPPWHPPTLMAVTQADWGVLRHQFGTILTAIIISTLAMLVNATSLEIVVKRELDLNQELRATGITNLGSGLGGGFVGFHSIALSSLSTHRLGVRNRLVGLFVAGFSGLILWRGVALLGFFPRFVVGGTLICLGLELFVDWLWKSWFRLPRQDYAMVVLIMLAMVLIGPLQGIAVGLAVAMGMFLLNYSRISVAKHVLSGASHQSHVQRPKTQRKAIQERGEQIYILELQGFIFFGSANRLYNQVRDRLNQSDLQPLRFIVLDFRLVNGIDSSAVLSFIKMEQLAAQQEIALVFTDLEASLYTRLKRGGALRDEAEVCHQFVDLDRGMEWCENQLLEGISWRRSRFLPLPLQLQRQFSDPTQVAVVMGYLTRQSLEAGEFLFEQAKSPDQLYFLESGQISISTPLASGGSQRLLTASAGTVMGAVEFYTGTPYGHTAIADQRSVIYGLATADLARMQQEHPQAAAALDAFSAGFLAECLAQAQQEVRKLLA